MAKTILVADDDPAILDAIKMILELDGYTVLITQDGRAVSKLSQMNPDLIILDIWMSGQDGRDICRHVKAYHSTRGIPIILMSAGRDVEVSAKEAGADDFMSKPFEMSKLLANVKKYIL